MNTLELITCLQNIKNQLLPILKDKHLCDSYAWLLLEKIYNKTKTELIIAKNLSFSPEQENQLKKWIYLLTQKQMPIQYIMGSVPFNDLDILVQPPILIPRPETEEWTINLVSLLKKLPNQELQVLDLATGSGCIGLTIAHHLPLAHVVATDISPHALQLAKKNSLLNNINNITFMQSDLFCALPMTQSFDIIITNPPYIAFSEKKDLDESVIKWEDEHALFAPDNGLAIIKKIIDLAPLYIKTNTEMRKLIIPQLVIEIGHKQGQVVKEYMISAGYNDIQVHKDLEKRDRIVVGRIDHVANSSTTK